MVKQVEIVLSPDGAMNTNGHTDYIARLLNVKKSEISFIRLVKRSVDARNKDIKIIYRYSVVINEPGFKPDEIKFEAKEAKSGLTVHIIGAGPAGLFAALRFCELGIKPVLFERGNDVRQRKFDIEEMIKSNTLNEASNYCYGEGGAGAFSDGKLFTRSNKRGNTGRILELLVLHGAPENILYEAHPHIGSDLLPGIIEAIRRRVISCGGEIMFGVRLTGIETQDNEIEGITINNEQKIPVKNLVLATGHSARDIYRLLHRLNISMEVKGFAVGVRIEHPQSLINKIRYRSSEWINLLPAASYNYVQQIKGRGVYTFCMCPGGEIVPAATSCFESVVNGMSRSGRETEFANSGWVVQILPEDIQGYGNGHLLAGLEFQEKLERDAFLQAGKGLFAPAQCLHDFTRKRKSDAIPPNSYKPGTHPADFHALLPEFISVRLNEALLKQEISINDFITNDAVMLGIESRTSSPLRITRNPVTHEHISLRGLYPCGEGAGYSGGIVSSALDGMKTAEKIFSIVCLKG